MEITMVILSRKRLRPRFFGQVWIKFLVEGTHPPGPDAQRGALTRDSSRVNPIGARWGGAPFSHADACLVPMWSGREELYFKGFKNELLHSIDQFDFAGRLYFNSPPRRICGHNPPCAFVTSSA